MKRATAIGHLVKMAEQASDRVALRDSDIGWPLEEMWADGAFLTLADTFEVGSVVLLLDEPADDLPWLARNPAGEWVGESLRLGKRPLLWSYRPLAGPPWNHDHRRLVRFWSAKDGLDNQVIEALRSRRLDKLPIVEPAASELADQLRVELQASRRHLRHLLEHYWDHNSRREHRGSDASPEDDLWRAASAISDMLDALEELGIAGG